MKTINIYKEHKTTIVAEKNTQNLYKEESDSDLVISHYYISEEDQSFLNSTLWYDTALGFNEAGFKYNLEKKLGLNFDKRQNKAFYDALDSQLVEVKFNYIEVEEQPKNTIVRGEWVKAALVFTPPADLESRIVETQLYNLETEHGERLAYGVDKKQLLEEAEKALKQGIKIKYEESYVSKEFKYFDENGKEYAC